MLKKIGIGLLVVLIVIQFIRPAKNISNAAAPNDISAKYNVPQNVYTTLQRACFDCHSNNTNYPWYADVQPVYWWLQHHVNEGKRELNFNEFAGYTKKRKLHKLEKIKKSVTEGWMPLDSYLWIHKDAKLTRDEATAIADWTDGLAAQIDKTESN